MPVRRGRKPLSGAAVTLFVLAAVFLAWTLICIPANFAQVQRDAARKKLELSPAEFVLATWSQPRPVLPAPHQIVGELWKTTVLTPIGSPRNLLFHVWATLSTALVGLFAGVALGLALAFLFVHVRVAERIALPLVVAMGNSGVPQIWQKGAIVVTGVFFPITLVMVRGLRSPQPALLDLMRSYDASRLQVLAKLRLPASLPYLFPGLKVAVAVAVVSTIVAELPTGAQAGLGSRLLVGSYNGLMLSLWATMVTASLLALGGVGLVGLAERLVVSRRGGAM